MSEKPEQFVLDIHMVFDTKDQRKAMFDHLVEVVGTPGEGQIKCRSIKTVYPEVR